MKKRTPIRKLWRDKKPGGTNPFGVILILMGVAVCIAGIYYIKKDIRAFGVSISGHGEPYGSASMDGYGLIFCGLIFVLLGLIIVFPKIKGKQRH
ncbi:MAG TPA: hypothetical protein VNZ49_07005 [Bacteroidia bacterium]|jgi:hypothetical protein|nr:hypothetical protein [Bacteroidia bacterium]